MIRPLSRRTALKGLGVSIALPWLEAMAPARAAGTAAKAAPNRLAFLYVPNGKNMADWTPRAEGRLSDLPAILEPLEAVKDDLLVLTGLTADKARPHGDGGGDHARALAAFLTGAQPRKTEGTDVRAGISVDQVAANRLADETRLPSIELGCDGSYTSGNCDSGYSCIYSSCISWRSATQALPKEVNPALAFGRLFAAKADPQRAARNARRKSVLDFVRDDAKDVENRLGANDRRKLDEYLSAVRDVERRITRSAAFPPVEAPDYAVPAKVPEAYPDHVAVMYDLIALAFQADITRVATFVLANEGDTRPYPFIGVKEGHHDLSHHENDARKKEKIRDINKFHTGKLAAFLKKLKDMREGDGSLLDHCTVCYGSGNSDGNAHNHDDLPILLAGKGCGTIAPGRHVRYPKDTPLNNLWVGLLERLGAKATAFGDSTGSLPGLSG